MQELTPHQYDLLTMGLCPFCKEAIRGHRTPSGSFAPEGWATLREHGIDPATGHRADCTHKEIKLA